MSWFKRKNMNNEQDYNPENAEQQQPQTEEIPFSDKRRFNTDGERVRVEVKDEKSKEPVKSPRETELENRLREETARREAAEGKLVGVKCASGCENRWKTAPNRDSSIF